MAKSTLRQPWPGLALLALLSACGSSSSLPDTTKPQVALVGVPATVSTDTLQVRAEASDDVGVREVRFYLNGELVVTDAAAPYEAALNFAQNGSYVLKVEAVDTTGNVSEARTQTITVTADRAAPTIEVTLPGATQTAPGRYEITVPGSYQVTVRVSDDLNLAAAEGSLVLNTPAGTVTQPIRQELGGQATEQTFALPVLTDAYNGTHTLTLQAVDVAGRRSAPVTVTLVIALPAATPPAAPAPAPADTERPRVQIVVPTDRVTQAGTYQVQLLTSDNVGITSLTGTLTIGGLSFPLTFDPRATTFDIPVTSAYNGTVTLTVTARDAAGNSTTVSESLVVAIP